MDFSSSDGPGETDGDWWHREWTKLSCDYNRPAKPEKVTTSEFPERFSQILGLYPV
jgi:hypothetical protein